MKTMIMTMKQIPTTTAMWKKKKNPTDALFTLLRLMVAWLESNIMMVSMKLKK
jgi:hypothetical protein